jgi:hypothetical protein
MLDELGCNLQGELGPECLPELGVLDLARLQVLELTGAEYTIEPVLLGFGE